MQHLTMNFGNQSFILIITDRHIFFLKNWLIYKKTWKTGQDVMHSSEYFNSNYIEFVGYYKHEK